MSAYARNQHGTTPFDMVGSMDDGTTQVDAAPATDWREKVREYIERPHVDQAEKPAGLDAAVNLVTVIGETVEEVGGCPAGVMYAGLMGTVSLQAFQFAVVILKHVGVVSESAHYLRWVGDTSTR